jgi:hypothetical protein
MRIYLRSPLLLWCIHHQTTAELLAFLDRAPDWQDTALYGHQ